MGIHGWGANSPLSLSLFLAEMFTPFDIIAISANYQPAKHNFICRHQIRLHRCPTFKITHIESRRELNAIQYSYFQLTPKVVGLLRNGLSRFTYAAVWSEYGKSCRTHQKRNSSDGAPSHRVGLRLYFGDARIKRILGGLHQFDLISKSSRTHSRRAHHRPFCCFTSDRGIDMGFLKFSTLSRGSGSVHDTESTPPQSSWF